MENKQFWFSLANKHHPQTGQTKAFLKGGASGELALDVGMQVVRVDIEVQHPQVLFLLNTCSDCLQNSLQQLIVH